MATQSKLNEKVNEVINTATAAQDAPTAKNEQWVVASTIEAKTALSRAYGELARLRNAKAVDGFRADGTPTKYVVCELKPNAYISALYALARDKGITFSADGKVLAKSTKTTKAAK